jgi:hypothetical protein
MSTIFNFVLMFVLTVFEERKFLFDLQAGSGGTQPAAKSGGAAAPGSRPHSVGPSASQSRADQVRQRAFRYFSCIRNCPSAFLNWNSNYLCHRYFII